MRRYAYDYSRSLRQDITSSKHDVNLYGYVSGDPLAFGDPNGEFPINLAWAVGAASFNFGLQVYLNYRANGGNLSAALQCVDLGNVAAAGAVGLFFPGGGVALTKAWGWAARGASFKRVGAAVIVAGSATAPLAFSLGTMVPSIPLNRVVPTFGTNCSCIPN